VILPIISNVLGTVLLVGGAAWSAISALRRRSPASRVLGTSLIAAGALVVGADHSLAQSTGLIVLQPLSEMVGIAVMFGRLSRRGTAGLRPHRYPPRDRAIRGLPSAA